MSSQINLYGEIKEGKLILHNRIALDTWISNLSEGDRIVAKFNLSKNYKTERQLRLLYKCLRDIASHTGHDIEDMKIALKLKAGLCFSHIIEGKDITVCKSISDFSIQEISEFIQFIDMWSTKTLNLPLLSFDDIKFLKS